MSIRNFLIGASIIAVSLISTVESSAQVSVEVRGPRHHRSYHSRYRHDRRVMHHRMEHRRRVMHHRREMMRRGR